MKNETRPKGIVIYENLTGTEKEYSFWNRLKRVLCRHEFHKGGKQMRYISTKMTPAFHSQIILEQEQDGYRFKKNTIDRQLLDKLITQEECDDYLDSQHQVCVRMNENYRIYNFTIN